MKQPQLVKLKHIHHNDGDITIVENGEEIPFKVERVYWLTGIESDQVRGNNATKTGKRVLVALKDKVEVELQDSSGKGLNFILDSPHVGLYVPQGYWSSIHFPKGAILICLVSNTFNESDYIRNYNNFLARDSKS